MSETPEPEGDGAGAAARSGRSALLVGTGILLSRLFGLVRQKVLAFYFGHGLEYDAFTAALRIPNLLQNLFGEGALSASFIPVYAGLRARGDEEGARRVAQRLLLVSQALSAQQSSSSDARGGSIDLTNLDRTVDDTDFRTLYANFAPFVAGKTWAQGDFNDDHVVNFTDFQILERHFGRSVPFGALPEASAVPEPASASFVLVAVAIMAGRRARRA